MIHLSDFYVGQTAYLSNGNTVLVEKVGRKYVAVNCSWHRYFYVGSFANESENNGLIEKCDFGPPLLLYPTEKAYKDAKLREIIKCKLIHAFKWTNISKFTTEQLKKVEAIIDDEEDDEERRQ